MCPGNRGNSIERQFLVTRRNKVLVTDVTYIRTWEGLAVLGGRAGSVLAKSCGLSDKRHDAPELVLDAVMKAVRTRGPAARSFIPTREPNTEVMLGSDFADRMVWSQV
jgi:hypothetical protein